MEMFDYIGEQNLEESAGLQIEVAIAAYHDVLTFPALPALTGATASGDYVSVGAELFVMKSGKKFQKWEGSLEKNSFNTKYAGSRGAKSPENTLTLINNAVNKELIGWLRANRNRKLIVAYRPLGETQYVFLGHEGLPAEINDASFDIPGEISGEKMTMIEIRSIYHHPYYIDSLPFTPAV